MFSLQDSTGSFIQLPIRNTLTARYPLVLSVDIVALDNFYPNLGQSSMAAKAEISKLALIRIPDPNRSTDLPLSIVYALTVDRFIL